MFCLSIEEILKALRTASFAVFATEIARRRARHRRWQSLEAPPILGIPDPILPDRPPWSDETTPFAPISSGLLVGQRASPGRRQGRARLVGDEIRDLEPGDILVATNLGPRWTPFFPILAAIVLDGGSIGQHAAATAREYGIPAVIGARLATRCIADGAQIIVDGTEGTVDFQQDIDKITMVAKPLRE